MSLQTESALQNPAPVSAAAPLLSIRSVSKRFGQNSVLTKFNLDIAEGEFLTVLGESGSGKTTLLRLIAGFESLDEGEIWMAGERLDNLPPYRRRVNTVFQQYALFPHYNVFENVAYGLRIAKLAKDDLRERVKQALAMVKMNGFANAKPGTLSGGQQQRVALARALVNCPRLLLLDEPLSALDANLRSQMQVELKLLQRDIGITFIFVTHDQHEALAMSDRVALMRHGKLEQVAPPREIYLKPSTAYVASFIGRSNILKCSVSKGIAHCAPIQFPTNVSSDHELYSLRPEAISIATRSKAAHDLVKFRGFVVNHSFQGAADLVTIRCESGLTLTARLEGHNSLEGEHEFAFGASDAVPVRESEP
jgi:putative spermidine/putrescine transport system ATP-binding protein